MGTGLTSQVKVGIFVFLTLLISFWLTFRFGKYGEKMHGYTLYASFENAYGVVKETPVYIAGIKVGQVVGKQLENSKATVKLLIYPQYKIPRDSRIYIRMRGMLGDKYLDIRPGNPESGYLREGEFIPSEEMPLDLESLSAKLGEVADNLKDITASLKEVLTTEETKASLKEIITNLKGFSENLAERMEKNADKIDKLISDMRKIAAYIREKSPELSEKLEKAADEVTDLLGGVKSDTKSAIADFRKAAADASDAVQEAKALLKKINAGEGILGSLVADKKMSEKFKNVISFFGDSVKASSQLQIQLIYRGEFEPVGENRHKNIFGLKISPRKNKFYLLEVASVPEMTVNETIIETTDQTAGTSTTVIQKTLSRKLKFSAEIGYRLGRFTLRGGIIQSTGGFGVDTSFFNDALVFTLDAYDFMRSTNPNLKVGLEILPWKYFYLYGGVDDAINSAGKMRYFIGGGVKLTDEDLRRLLGLAATAALVGSY